MKRSHCTGRGAMASLYVPPFASLHNSSWHSKESLREAKGNLRLQPWDAHTQSLDGRLQPLDGRTKPANGDFSTLRGTFQHAAIVCAARCECNRSVPEGNRHLQGGSSEPCRRPGISVQPASAMQAAGAALMMRQKKDRSVTERFVAACLWAAQPDEASPVTERLLM